jgi:hypothetical protein
MGSHLAVLFCSSLFAAVQHTSTTHCKSITFRLRPCRDSSASFAHIGHFFRVSDGVSTLGVADVDTLRLAGWENEARVRFDRHGLTQGQAACLSIQIGRRRRFVGSDPPERISPLALQLRVQR